MLCALILSGCTGNQAEPKPDEKKEPEIQEPSADMNTDTEEVNTIMRMKINETYVEVEWEKNESAEALKELTAEGPLVIQMSMYGGFEQAGQIGAELPSSDVQTVTDYGDIVLYSGNQLVVFYGSNSWAYTRLGHIIGCTQEEMTELLAYGDVNITLSSE